MLDNAAARQLLFTVAGHQAGAAEAFETLYREFAPLFLGIARRIVRRRELAEEVLHDTFTKIWRSADTFDPLGTPIGWMTAIVRNRALDLVESHDVARVSSYHDTIDEDPDGALDRLFDWGETAEDSLDRKRVARWLRTCIEELDAVERQSLVLAYEHGLSHGELATHLQKPLGTIKTWMRRGLKNLRECVETCLGGSR